MVKDCQHRPWRSNSTEELRPLFELQGRGDAIDVRFVHKPSLGPSISFGMRGPVSFSIVLEQEMFRTHT
jgi:hypothetical protein